MCHIVALQKDEGEKDEVFLLKRHTEPFDNDLSRWKYSMFRSPLEDIWWVRSEKGVHATMFVSSSWIYHPFIMAKNVAAISAVNI